MPNLIRRVMLRALTRRTVTIDNRRPARPNLRLEALEDRTVPAVYDVYAIDAANGVNSGKVFVDGVETVLPSAYDPSVVPTPANNYTLINDAFAALLDNNDDEIVLHGTFDWSTGVAFASWARGSDGKLSTDTGGTADDDNDNYSIYVQPDLDDVTITAATPVNGVYGARIIGPGDLAGVDAEAFLYFGTDVPGTNQGWTISNLQIEGFDGAIQMYNFEGGSTDAYSGTTITNNRIIVPADVDSAIDETGNVGILLGFGTDQIISGNVIQLAGTGKSVSANLASSTGIQTQTGAPGALYDGLEITGNTISVTGPPNATASATEVVVGVWENANASGSNITVSGNTFTGSQSAPAANRERGFIVTSHSSATTTVTYSGNTVTRGNIGFQWLPAGFGADFSGADPIVFTGNLVTGTGTGVLVQSNGVVDLIRNTFSNNTTAVRVETGSLTGFTRNTVTGNATGIVIGPNAGTTGAIEFNNLGGNPGLALVNQTGVEIDASDNWWGTTDPLGIDAEHTTGVDDSAAQVAPLGPTVTSAAAATFATTRPNSFTVTTSSVNTVTLSVPSGLPAGVDFVDNLDGTATLSGTPTSMTGTFTFAILIDDGTNAVVRQTFALTVVTPPTFTSAATTTFSLNAANTFNVTTQAGFPTGTTLTRTGALPTGVTFNTTTGLLSGTPAAGTGGVYVLTFTASNGGNSSTSQTFTLNVTGSPTFTSPNAKAFTLNQSGSFTVVTRGYSPTNSTAITITAGSLPAGLSFADNGDGTATISGTPTGSTGVTPITLTASNGVGDAGTQVLNITVGTAPAITSAPVAGFTIGTSGSFSFTADPGFPTATTFGLSGSLPTGLSFNPATGVLSGTPAAGTGGTYEFVVTASNAAASATQNFTLTVLGKPTITSPNTASFVNGVAGSFTVTATGSPLPTLTTFGLPSWLMVTDNSDGTFTLSGTPTEGGTFQVTLVAKNTAAGNPNTGSATQVLTITVVDPAAITSAASASFTTGTAGSFQVTATGTPAPTVTVTGALPAGVTFNPATRQFTGTPAATAGGTYELVVTATGAGSPAVQNFTLTVNQPPRVTSAAAATFRIGTAGTFTISTTGFPAASITPSALPPGLSLSDNGDGTATISGTPTGSGARYQITLVASNGVTVPATQTLTLTVGEAPAITSGSATTFFAGAASQFQVRTTGFAVPTVTLTGAPSWLTYNAATGRLQGTPPANALGEFTFTITAANGVGTPATQTFTLTVVGPPVFGPISIPALTVGVPMAPVTVTVIGELTSPVAETNTTTPTVPGLPPGLTVVDNGDGTATISGTPTATGTTAGITLTAGNDFGNSTSAAFTVTVVQAPVFTTGTTTNFARGVQNVFPVRVTAGFPVANNFFGTLPTGALCRRGSG
jgi:hypothetical protein